MSSLKQSAASAGSAGLSMLAKTVRIALGVPYFLLNASFAIFAVLMFTAILGLDLDADPYIKHGMMLGSFLLILPTVLKMLDYKQARDFLSWVGSKDDFNKDLARYAEKIKLSTKLSDEQKSSITGGFEELGKDLTTEKPKAARTAIAAFHVGVGKLSGILPALSALSEDFEEIEERVEGGKALAGCIRPPFVELASGWLSGIIILIATFL